jgi:RNA polymerase sigma-70 factor (sigma-E family)
VHGQAHHPLSVERGVCRAGKRRIFGRPLGQQDGSPGASYIEAGWFRRMVGVVTFEEFLAEQTGALLRLAGVLSGDSSLAEDIVQEVLVRVGRQWDRIEGSESPGAYVRRMVVNEYLSWHRKWGRTAVRHYVPNGDRQAVEADPAQAYAERDEMLATLKRLPRRQRAVLVLRYYEDLADADIALVLGCSQVTVRTHAARALRALRVQVLADTTSADTPHLTEGDVGHARPR